MLMTARSVGMSNSFPSWETVTDSTRSVPLMDTRLAFITVLMALFCRLWTVDSSALKSGLLWTMVVSVTVSAMRAMSMALLPPPNMVTFFPTISSLGGRMYVTPFPKNSSSPGHPIFLGLKLPIPMAMMTDFAWYVPLSVVTMSSPSPFSIVSTLSFSLMSHSTDSAWA